jgi:hypothetical protein
VPSVRLDFSNTGIWVRSPVHRQAKQAFQRSRTPYRQPGALACYRTYHPATFLKIYLYGYLNRVQSSRQLEREAQRNIELMWLTKRLAPEFKMISNFRHDDGLAIRATCQQFVMLCCNLGLFAHAMAAIDGSKFKAVDKPRNSFLSSQYICWPPLIESVEPVMKSASSAVRNTTPRAIS